MKIGGMLCLAAGLLLAAGGAPAQDKPVELTLSHWVPPTHPLQAAIQDWIDSIRTDSNGSITGTIFPAQQLGKAFDHYDMARDGIADVAYVNPGYQPGRFPIIAAGELPFLMTNAKGGSAAFDAWYRKYAEREMGDVHFCLAYVHDPGTLHSRKKITVPADIGGLKVRPPNATIAGLVKQLGGANVQGSAPEARDMLEKGVADAITFPWGSMVLFGIDRVVKYHIDMPLYVGNFVWVMNKDKYEAMSAAQRKVIDDHCTTLWAERMASPWADFEFAGRAKIADEPGHEIVTPTPEQMALWRAQAGPAEQEWAAGARRAGVDPDQVLNELKASLADRHSAF